MAKVISTLRCSVCLLLICALAVSLLGCSELDDLLGRRGNDQTQSGLSGQAVVQTPDTTPQLTYGTVNADALNIRSGPGTEHASVGMLPNGSPVEILEVSGNWGRIESGWVCLDYILFRDTPADPLPSQPQASQPQASQPQVSTPQSDSAIVGQWIWAIPMPETGQIYRNTTVNYYADGTYELTEHDCIFMYKEGEGWIRDPDAPGAGSQCQNGTYTFDGSTLIHNCTFIEWEDPLTEPRVTTYQISLSGDEMIIDGTQYWYKGDMQAVGKHLMGK